MSEENLEVPVTQSEDFSAELDCDRMDFSDLKDKQFACMVSTGDRNQCKALTSTLHGPFDFFGMVEVVGKTWAEHQHHMKPFVLTTKLKQRAAFLDQGTVDYIESNYSRIIQVGLLEEILFDEDDDVVIKAGVVETENKIFNKEDNNE